jgi:hypothetical protein
MSKKNKKRSTQVVLKTRVKMMIRFFLIAFHLTLKLGFADTHQNQGLRRRNSACPDGYGGINCKSGVDECTASAYPCTGGKKEGSFCVDYDPPLKFNVVAFLGIMHYFPMLATSRTM